MDAIDKAIEESLRRQRAGETLPRHSEIAAERKQASAHSTCAASALDPYSPEATLLRAKSEDDDGYDPYSDYMDQLARSNTYEDGLEEDPWR